MYSVFTTPDRVQQPYTEVELLDSKGHTDLTSEAGMINSQRRKAGELGAIGVILGTVEDATAGQKVAKAILGTSANRKGKAIAIHIPSDSVGCVRRVPRLRGRCWLRAAQRHLRVSAQRGVIGLAALGASLSSLNGPDPAAGGCLSNSPVARLSGGHTPLRVHEGCTSVPEHCIGTDA